MIIIVYKENRQEKLLPIFYCHLVRARGNVSAGSLFVGTEVIGISTSLSSKAFGPMIENKSLPGKEILEASCSVERATM